MPPPYLKKPEWFLRNIPDEKLMRRLGERITRFYDDLFEEMIYRAHHNSFKVSYSDVFYNDFVDYIVKACRLKKNFWKFLPHGSTMKYMHERRKRFFRYLKKHDLIGDIRWSFDFWLSQLSFWYITVKSFYDTWYKVNYENYTIPQVVTWEDAIVLYVIYDFTKSYEYSEGKCIRKKWLKKYEKYIEIEREERRKLFKTSLS